MSFLLDSDTLIDALHGRTAVTTWMTEHAADGLATSIISVAELYDGAYRSADPARHLTSVRRLIRDLVVLTLADPIADQFARLRADLRGRGQLIPDLDLLIAATALDRQLTLVTRNVRHFQRIPALPLVSLL